jgi:crotonobetainyl-CoA:carnitine CoA-transferase CaiB-like acyl-CoA transferase
VLAQRPRQAWLADLTAGGVPCGAVRSVAEALSDPHVAARRMVEAVEHAALGTIKVLGVPIKLSGTPGSVRSAPPTLGQHTTPVLTELGIAEDAIDGLRRRRVI